MRTAVQSRASIFLTKHKGELEFFKTLKVKLKRFFASKVGRKLRREAQAAGLNHASKRTSTIDETSWLEPTSFALFVIAIYFASTVTHLKSYLLL